MQNSQHNSKKARCYLYFLSPVYWVICALFPVTEVSVKADAIIINGLYFPTYEKPWKFSYQLNFYLEQKYVRENHIPYFVVGIKSIVRCIFLTEQCLVWGGKALNALKQSKFLVNIVFRKFRMQAIHAFSWQCIVWYLWNHSSLSQV